MDIQVTLSRAHKVTERLKALMQEQSAKVAKNLGVVAITGLTGEAQIASFANMTADGFAALESFKHYNTALCTIRKQISAANTLFGVADLLAEQESMSRLQGVLVSALNETDSSAIQPEQLAGYTPVGDGQRSSFRSPSINVALLNAEQRARLDAQLVATRKAIFTISDKVADANAHKITLALDGDLAALLGLS